MERRSSASDNDLLADGAKELGLALSPAVVPDLLRYLDLLYVWNAYAGFTAIARRDAVRLHLLDSLSLVPFLGDLQRIADLGSGAGLPGIPVALALSAATVTLVESKRRRCSFLRETIRQLGLAQRVSVVEADAKVVVASMLGTQDAVVARAFAPPSEVLSLAAPLLSSGGLVALMGGGVGVGDLSRDAEPGGLVLESSRIFCLPGGKESRAIAAFRKLRTNCFT